MKYREICKKIDRKNRELKLTSKELQRLTIRQLLALSSLTSNQGWKIKTK